VNADSRIRLTIEDPVAVITMDRPEQLNALTPEMLVDLRQAFAEAAASSDVVGIVVTGSGRGFCAGLDTGELETVAQEATEQPQDVPGRREDDPAGMFTYLLEIEKPVIAAVNGPTAGGGFVLACAADLRFFSERAWVKPVFAQRGLAAEHTISWLLTQQLGAAATLDLLWSSRRIEAAEAYRLGLAQRLVPHDQVVAEAVAYVQDLAASGSPSSFASSKRMVYGQTATSLREAAAENDVISWQAVLHPDALEGVRAYLERRPPRFARIGARG
jgi:enoyl-CoA hydratase/carnithine racemase